MKLANGTMPSIDHRSRVALADRPPPYNLEAERSVLAACMMDDRAADDCLLILRPDDFFRDAHAETWRAIMALRDEGEVPEALAVIDRLERAGRLEALGGNEFLRELFESVPHAANATYHAGIVREKAIARKLIDACTEVLRACYSLQHTAPELIKMAEESVFAIAEREVGSNVVDMETIITEAMERIRRRQQGEFSGLKTGFVDLDYLLGGLRPGSLAILAARPSIGKTALGMAIATNVGADMKKPPLFMSLEMNRDELGDRLMSAWAEIDGYKLRSQAHLLGDPGPHRPGAGWEKLYRAAGHLVRVPIRIDDTAMRTVSQIAATARRVKRQGGLAMIMIDYLGLIDGQPTGRESTQETTARISKRLKQLARELDVVVLALHQLNRKVEERDDRRPRLSDLRDSGQIEADADAVMLLHRPEFYDPNDQPGVANVIVAKNRNGATGMIELAFRKEWARFDSLARRVEPGVAGWTDDTSF